MFIYEMHVRGFTKLADVEHPGTFLGMIEKIPYLKSLRIDAVELLPIFTFPKGKNYWGYGSTDFFSPDPRYGVDNPSAEFRLLVDELHKARIKVILDVVYNHTAGKVFPDYFYTDANFSGCGDTLNTNSPPVQRFILDSLRFWIEEMGVDGFRFDLASILTRGTDGTPLSPSPLIEEISQLDAILIAEPWDCGGLYQVGEFPKWGPWREWNGRFRDTVRRFIKGDSGQAKAFANALRGSPDLYASPSSSINFVTCHDGFSLADLVSYNKKHNTANGEHNRDGSDYNDSWNCGVEGQTKNPAILELRKRQRQNFLLALFAARGNPMLLMGDEYGRTAKGNNNTWCQDNELSWFDWSKKPDIHPFRPKGKWSFHTVKDHFVAGSCDSHDIVFNASHLPVDHNGLKLPPYSSKLTPKVASCPVD